jgi:hypothetical protein
MREPLPPKFEWRVQRVALFLALFMQCCLELCCFRLLTPSALFEQTLRIAMLDAAARKQAIYDDLCAHGGQFFLFINGHAWPVCASAYMCWWCIGRTALFELDRLHTAEQQASPLARSRSQKCMSDTSRSSKRTLQPQLRRLAAQLRTVLFHIDRSSNAPTNCTLQCVQTVTIMRAHEPMQVHT